VVPIIHQLQRQTFQKQGNQKRYLTLNLAEPVGLALLKNGTGVKIVKQSKCCWLCIIHCL